ncbi:hypothetical protein ACIBI9_28970 [Nonomuraea sp. NPDC050451]
MNDAEIIAEARRPLTPLLWWNDPGPRGRPPSWAVGRQANVTHGWYGPAS